MKEILFVGNPNMHASILKQIHYSSKYKVKKAKNIRKAAKIVDALNPDFILCAGKITVDNEGNYVLQLD